MKILLFLLLLQFITSRFRDKNILCCGLFGFSGKENFDPAKIKILALYNQSRGTDATGVFTLNQGVIKTTEKAEDYMKKVITPCKLLIGHTRSKTTGYNTESNAHPFRYNNIVMAHNGNIDNWKELLKRHLFDEKDFDVDSQVLAATLARYNHPGIFSEMSGGAAIIFTDLATSEKEKKPEGKFPALGWDRNSINPSPLVYLFRNSLRPLFIGIGKEGMYMSSLDKALEIIECREIKEITPLTLYTINEGVINSGVVIPHFTKPYIYSRNTNTSAQDTYDDDVYNDLFRRNIIYDSNTWGGQLEDSPIDSFVKASTDISSLHISKGSYYRINNDASIKGEVENDKGELTLVNKYYFDAPIVLENGCWAKVTANYTEKGTDKKICDEGNWVYVTYVDYKERKATIQCGDIFWKNIQTKHLRRLVNETYLKSLISSQSPFDIKKHNKNNTETPPPTLPAKVYDSLEEEISIKIEGLMDFQIDGVILATVLGRVRQLADKIDNFLVANRLLESHEDKVSEFSAECTNIVDDALLDFEQFEIETDADTESSTDERPAIID